MGQDGILGNLRYEQRGHSWALDLGEALARYDMLHNKFTNKTMPGIDEARHDSVRSLNQLLSNHNFSCRVPEIREGADSPISKVMKDVIEEMHSRASPAHAAFMLMGNSDYFMALYGSSNSEDNNNEVRALAQNRVESIPHLCEGVVIRVEAVTRLVLSPPFGPLPLRDKLKQAMEPIIILFVSADPTDAGRLQLQEEYRTLITITQQTAIPDIFKLEALPNCRPEDLTNGLLRHQPTIFHFSGHGAREGLCVMGSDGTVRILEPEALGRVLKLAADEQLKGVILNACYSEDQAQYILEAVGHVVGMEGSLQDEAAIAFTREFYNALGAGRSFDNAFEWAVAGTGLSRETSELQPRLLTRRQ